MDTLRGKEEVKHFSALERSGRLAWAPVFLRALVEGCPFPIQPVQADGGSGFVAAFEEGCLRLGIRLFVLPPRSPKLNGDRADLLAYYNGGRPHRAL